MFYDFQTTIKSIIGGQVSSLKWFMPLHCIVDLFGMQSQSKMHRMGTLFVFKSILDTLFASLMDVG